MILHSNTLHYLENKLVEELSKYELFQNPKINNSPRAVGDTVQDVIGDILPSCFPAGMIDEFSSDFARRSMEDVAFFDNDGNYYAIDIKTHNLSTNFNMPNLISVERLARFYRDVKKFFVVLIVEYEVEEGHLAFTKIRFVPIEHLDWSCLTIGALGWGQIQIANSNNIVIKRENKRIDWMLTLCDVMDEFYPREINKITARIEYFHSVRSFWESKKASEG